MKTVISLGISFCLALGLQIAVELNGVEFSVQPDSRQIDSDNTHFKIIDGKIYFLSNQSKWVERNNFVWRNAEGQYYKHLNGRIFYSNDGLDWTLIANLSKSESDEIPFAIR